jgi:hypothetical protein
MSVTSQVTDTKREDKGDIMRQKNISRKTETSNIEILLTFKTLCTMKKNEFSFFRTVFSAGLAATLLLGGCAQEETVGSGKTSDGTKVARISITRATADTRSGAGASNPVGQHLLTLGTTGLIFFVDNAGLIAEVLKIDKEATTDIDNQIVDLDELTDGGVTFKVPDNSAKVYIYMNLPLRVETAITGNLSVLAGSNFATSVGSKLIGVDELADPSDYGVNKVPVSGSAPLEEELYLSEQYDYTAEVELKAMASRIEIQSITLDSKTPGQTVEEYELEAILVNNIYLEANLDGAYTTGLTNYGTDIHAYEEHHANFRYNTNDQSKYLFTSGGLDGDNKPIALGGDATALKKYPDLTEGDPHEKVWGYNVFPNDLPGINTQIYLPHIIIHLIKVTVDPDGSGGSDAVTYTKDSVGAELWLTVRGYTKDGTRISTFDRGMAYLIGGDDGMTIYIEDFGIFPEVPTDEDVTVKVTASAIDWETTSVEPAI